MDRVQAVLDDIRDDLVFRTLPGADLEQVRVRSAPQWLCNVWPAETKAMAIGVSVFFRPEVGTDWSPEKIASLMAHELTHVRQFRQMGKATLMIRYVSDYLRGRKSGLNHFDAYQAIELEKEARDIAKAYRDGLPETASLGLRAGR